MAIEPDCRNVLPTPPMVRLKNKMGNDDPAMNMMQLKKKNDLRGRNHHPAFDMPRQEKC